MSAGHLALVHSAPGPLAQMQARLQVEPKTEANAVRASLFRPGRVVAIGFTDFARPGPYRFMTMFGPPVLEAVQRILQRLDLEPHQVEARGQAMGDVVILTRAAPIKPLAFVAEGLDACQITDALDRLVQQGWRPDPTLRP